MFILAHLLAGLLIGIFLFFIFHDRLVILFAALGSVLPDLIDKPIGHIILSGSLNYGRIYAHSLLFAGLVLLIGLIISIRYRRASPLTLALVAGILSHQLLDAMWLEPMNWYWPVFGPFHGVPERSFFLRAFWGEITNPGEWIAGGLILLVGFLIFLWPDRITRFQSWFPNRFTLLVTLIFFSVIVFGLVIVASGGIG
jgi:membrane-bound metal-dependent hydrolase YbcI (DUF457 family)